MKKFFYLTILLLLTIFPGGCGDSAKETDVKDIPTEVATGKVVEPNDDGKSDGTKPAETKPDTKIDETKPEVKPTATVQAGKDYVVADDNLSNLQLFFEQINLKISLFVHIYRGYLSDYQFCFSLFLSILSCCFQYIMQFHLKMWTEPTSLCTKIFAQRKNDIILLV